jgi:hypothetical protein
MSTFLFFNVALQYSCVAPTDVAPVMLPQTAIAQTNLAKAVTYILTTQPAVSYETFRPPELYALITSNEYELGALFGAVKYKSCLQECAAIWCLRICSWCNLYGYL